MTDAELAAAHEAVKRIEDGARGAAGATGVDATEREAAVAVLRQAVALRRVLGNWIVTRATSAHQAAEAR